MTNYKLNTNLSRRTVLKIGSGGAVGDADV